MPCDTIEIDREEVAAYQRVIEALRREGTERDVLHWALDLYPAVIERAGTHRVGFLLAGPNGGPALAFTHANEYGRRIYGQRIVGEPVRLRIPAGELREKHDAAVAVGGAGGGYLTENGDLNIHEHPVVRLDGRVIQCRFVVNEHPRSTDGTRYSQFIWRADDGG